MKARVCVSYRSTCWISASVSSTGESFRAAISPASSAIERSWSSVAMGVLPFGPEYSVDAPRGDGYPWVASVSKGERTMAFMTKDGFRLYYEDTGDSAP